MAQLLLSPIGILVQQLSNAGQPLSGGQVFIYVAGTTTPVTTYTDSTGTTPNSNPIVLNSAGRLPNVSVWVPSNTPHKLILEDSNGVTLSTIDQLYGINDPFLINQVSTTLPTGGGTANAQTITNSTPIATQVNGTEQWYTPGVANTGATNINVDSLGNMAVHYLTKALVGGELQPGVPVILKSDGTFWNLAWSAKGPAADFYVDTGTVNAAVITVNAAQNPSLLKGALFKVQWGVANTNTGNATIAINGGSALPLTLQDSITNCTAGSLIAGVIYEIILNGNPATSAAVQNPSRVTGSFTITLTGMTAGTTGTINYAIEPSGKMASAWAPSAITGTSNTNAMTGTGVPAALTTGTSKRYILQLEDNTGTNIGSILTGTSTTWTYGAGGSLNNTGFTTSGTKGLPPGSAFAFTLD